MEKGILIVRGKAVEPPYVIRQETDKIFVNEQLIYPFAEIEKPKRKPLFRAEPEISEFKVPPNIQETLEDFQTSWASGLVRDEKSLLKDASGLVREKDLIKDASGLVRDADAFIQDYEFEKEALEQVLKSKNISYVETEKYHDVLIPVEKEWGVIALFNEAERMRVTAELDKEKSLSPRYPYNDAAKFKKYIETGLMEGDMIIIDDDHIEFIPQEQVDTVAKDISGFDSLHAEEKAEKLTDKLLLDSSRPPGPAFKSAIIFFPHISWQREAVGGYSHYPFSLATKLRNRKYRTWIFLDTNVTLKIWAQYLGLGSRLGLKVIYNQGHGNDNVIAVGEPSLKGNWYYFNDQFVYKYARLYKTIVYIHSCATLSDNRLATAFLNRGACTYGGWKVPTSASPTYCDRCDDKFWRVLIHLNGTTGQACRTLNRYDRWFLCRGDPNCRLP
jgi:hypothetical protein